MGKIQIYYFSGTGNTAWIVKKLARNLEKLGNSVNIASCEDAMAMNIDADIVGIAFPIHSSYAPKVFSDFLNKMPKVNNTPLFGIVTSGYMAGDVLSFEGERLKDKGYIPFLYRTIIVANNLHLPVLCPLKVTKKEKVDKRLTRINNQIKDITIKINDKKSDIRGNDIIGKSFGILQRSIGKIHEEYNFKGFSSDQKCTKCKWCIKHCPANNIALKEGKIIFENRCIICMRCYNFCPNKAIQMTNRTQNISKYERYAGPEGLSYKTFFRTHKRSDNEG